jgi:hypothetical protein
MRGTLHRFLIAQASPGGYSVLVMELWRIADPDGSSNTALGMPGITLIDASLGQQEHAPLSLRQQRSIETGNAAAHDDVIILSHSLTL